MGRTIEFNSNLTKIGRVVTISFRNTVYLQLCSLRIVIQAVCIQTEYTMCGCVLSDRQNQPAKPTPCSMGLMRVCVALVRITNAPLKI